MRKGGGRAKGSDFERHVARHILKAAGPRFSSKDCYRTPMSGGHRFARQKDPGDLVISDRLQRIFPFTVECKKDEQYEPWHFFAMPYCEKSWLEPKWLVQANEEAEGTTRHPLLVMGRNFMPDFCTLRNSFSLPKWLENIPGLAFSDEKGGQWILTLFDDFLKIFSNQPALTRRK